MRLLLACLLCVMSLMGCSGKDNASERPDVPNVFVTIEPLAYFVERIAPKGTDVGVLIPSGQDPHTFQVTPRQMTMLSWSKLLLTVGSPFEAELMVRVSQAYRRVKVVNLVSGQPLLLMAPHAHEQTAESSNTHTYPIEMEESDPHVWMSPRIAMLIAKRTYGELCLVWPDRKEQMQQNLRKLLKDLTDLDAKLKEALAPLKGKRFYVFHPAFGYFAMEYHLKQKAVELGGKSPGPKQIVEIIRKAQADKVRVIFVQPQFSSQAAEVIAKQINGVVVEIDPLARDYIVNMHHVADEVSKAMKP